MYFCVVNISLSYEYGQSAKLLQMSSYDYVLKLNFFRTYLQVPPPPCHIQNSTARLIKISTDLDVLLVAGGFVGVCGFCAVWNCILADFPGDMIFLGLWHLLQLIFGLELQSADVWRKNKSQKYLAAK